MSSWGVSKRRLPVPQPAAPALRVPTGTAGGGAIRYAELPFAYSPLLHRTALLFCGLLPFALVDALGWWTTLATAIVAAGELPDRR
jgi:hypothetical protein